MPIYEFYCGSCHTVFNFLSRTVNTTALPPCPRCRRKLSRQVSMFAAPRGAKAPGGEGGEGGGGDDADFPVDDARMERAMESLASEAESINEDDPRQAAGLMRKFSKMTGMDFGKGMEEALQRMEAGEDPEAIEQELGDALDAEDPFTAPGAGGKGKAGRGRRGRAPARDRTLYEM